MNQSSAPEELFWNRLLSASEAIESTDESVESLIALLSGLEEGFYDRFDPADSFQAYAAVSLCRALRRRLCR